jgi:hypothetical protein
MDNSVAEILGQRGIRRAQSRDVHRSRAADAFWLRREAIEGCHVFSS